LPLSHPAETILDVLFSYAVAARQGHVELATHIAEVINRRGWNQTEAAAHLGVDQPRVSHLLRGRLSMFSIDALLGYLKRLDVKMQFELEDPVGEPGGKVLVAV
jgi:predicted XRE-type DNA-binding protein